MTEMSSASEVRGICAAVTLRSFSGRRRITLLHDDPSAQAPWTSTTFFCAIAFSFPIVHSRKYCLATPKPAANRALYPRAGKQAPTWCPANSITFSPQGHCAAFATCSTETLAPSSSCTWSSLHVGDQPERSCPHWGRPRNEALALQRSLIFRRSPHPFRPSARSRRIHSRMYGEQFRNSIFRSWQSHRKWTD